MNSTQTRSGTLYLVATPIGNLEDITQRAVRVLGEVDLIAAEDTRHTRKLLAALGLNKPLESLHGDSGPRKVLHIIELLHQGQDVALVSDAGTPLIADPGAELVQACAKADIPVVIIPGASAVTAAVALAGFGADSFLFAGYPPRKASERRQFIEGIASQRHPVVLYEAPHRIQKTLQELAETLPAERQVAVCRELTKLHEEIVRGTAAEVATAFEGREPKGEFTIVIAPSSQPPAVPSVGDPEAAARLLATLGLSTKEIAEVLAAATGLSKNEAYQLALRQR